MEEEHPKEAQRKEDSTKSQTQTDATRTSCSPKTTEAIIKATMPGKTEMKRKKMTAMLMMLRLTSVPAILKMMMERTSSKTWTEITNIDLSLIDMMHVVLMINSKRSFLLMVEQALRRNSTSRTGTELLEEDQMLSWPTTMTLMMRKRCFKP